VKAAFGAFGALVALGVVFLGLAAIFSILERVCPAIPGQRWLRRGRAVDLCYWFLMPFVSGAVVKVSVLGAVLCVALLLGLPHDRAHLDAWVEGRRAWVGLQPRALQAIEIIVLADLLGYWAHRLLHRGALWKFHAVHHAPRIVDWLSASRVHPVNEVVTRVLQTVPLFFLGFRGEVLAGVAPLFTIYAVFLHANLSWSFGPLRYVIASPTFHRWHHTAEEEGRDKNFAGLFPFFDLLFGTFYMPRGVRPTRFGISGEAVPEGLLGQLAYPFHREA
jgi:sterol desaturase/sphingolipid hydroxylase (fatty acid hydroxylase superfamily)